MEKSVENIINIFAEYGVTQWEDWFYDIIHFGDADPIGCWNSEDYPADTITTTHRLLLKNHFRVNSFETAFFNQFSEIIRNQQAYDNFGQLAETCLLVVSNLKLQNCKDLVWEFYLEDKSKNFKEATHAYSPYNLALDALSYLNLEKKEIENCLKKCEIDLPSMKHNAAFYGHILRFAYKQDKFIGHGQGVKLFFDLLDKSLLHLQTIAKTQIPLQTHVFLELITDLYLNRKPYFEEFFYHWLFQENKYEKIGFPNAVYDALSKATKESRVLKETDLKNWTSIDPIDVQKILQNGDISISSSKEAKMRATKNASSYKQELLAA